MVSKRKRVAILGSTGSIGCNSLSVIDALSSDYELISVSGHSNWSLLGQQVCQYHPQKVVSTDTAHIAELKELLKGEDVEILGGAESLAEIAADPDIDIVIVAVVGSAGLPAVRAAVEAGKTVAVANKESLVSAGCFLMPLAQKCGATILPIDSEHSAILQAMQSGGRDEVEKIIITASGGPFRRASVDEIANADLAAALNHPTWDMGPKISIDSATMMNKALEIIEARWLFDLKSEQIEVLVHPESIIHSMVEFCDGSVIAQMSPPDMRLPIQYALTWPRRMPGQIKRLNLHELGQLTFEPPDMERFPAIRLGFEVADRGGSAGAVLNGANEAAVQAFRDGKIRFTQIVELVECCLDNHSWIENPDLEQLLRADSWARLEVSRRVVELGRSRVC